MLRVRWHSGVLVMILGTWGAVAQTGVFRSNADMILINATVLDRHSRPVRGLSRDSFRLLDERTEQNIKYFGEEDSPVSLVVLFDASGSMGYQLSRTRQTVAKLLDDSQTGDEFSLITLSDTPRLERGWTDNAADIQNRLLSSEAHGRTPLLDAIQLGLKQFATARNRRHALIVLSDGGDNRSRLRERDLTPILAEADVQMYAIDITDPSNLGLKLPEETNGGLLQRLCDRAGGRYFQVNSPNDIAAAVEEAAKDIRSQYVLGYASPNSTGDGRYHHVQLKLLPPADSKHLSVYWRRGYRVPSQ